MGLFRAFAEKEQSSFPSQAVDPTKLRVALGGLEGNKFAVGEPFCTLIIVIKICDAFQQRCQVCVAQSLPLQAGLP